MKSKLFAGSALAALMASGPALAQTHNLIYGNPDADPANTEVTVTIDVAVESIAHLVVLQPTGTATIDDPTDRTMGNPSSEGSDYDVAHWATLRLSTNFDVDAIQISYTKVNDIRNNATGDPTTTFNGSSDEWFGGAVCSTGATCGANVLGVYPQAGNVSAGSIAGGGGGLVSNNGSTDSAPLVVRSVIAGGNAAPDAVYSNGNHIIGVGLSTNWGRTQIGQPVFALPGTYSINMDATIIPEV